MLRHGEVQLPDLLRQVMAEAVMGAFRYELEASPFLDTAGGYQDVVGPQHRLAVAHSVVDDEVEQVYVARQHRRTGVADTRVDEAERQVRVAGYPSAWLAVVAGNTRGPEIL